MRMCKIASVCRILCHPCCVDCKDKRCDVRCLNSPELCGCWEDTAPPQRAEDWVPKQKANPCKSKIDRQELLRLHNQGLLLREIAERLGCHVSSVCTILRSMGVKRYG